MKDKDDTSLVFKIYESLPSSDFMERVKATTLSEQGEYLRRTEPNLPEILDDHAALRNTPKGSLAHAYCDFMEEAGFTAAGLVAESDKLGRPKYDDLTQWFMERSRDTHDLFHVLTGTMSFFGPRPERPEFVAQLVENIPYYDLRHSVNPGITGWAQIRYPYGSSDEDAKQELQYDLYYIKNYSLFLDIAIVIQTAQVILWGKGR